MRKILLAAGLTMTVGCGMQEQEPQERTSIERPEQLQDYNNQAEAATFDQLSSDPQLLAANVEALSDEATASLADGDTNVAAVNETALYFTSDRALNVVRERICEKPENDVIVSIKRGMEHSLTRTGLRGTVERYFKFSADLKRTWSNDNNDLVCDENGKHIDLDQIDFASNVKLSAEFKRQKSQWLKVTTRRGEEYTAKRAFLSEGVRNVSWSSVSTDEEAGTLTAERSVTLDVTRNFSVEKPNGQSFAFETSVSTKEGAPLEQIIVRDLATHEPLKRTIKSGTIIGARKDKGYLETSFDNVVYETANPCMPVSGEIKGAMYKDGSEEPVRQYSILFNGADATITFADGASEQYLPEGCELEDIALNEHAEDSDTAAEGSSEQ